MKFNLTNILLQLMIFINTSFIILTQMTSLRQPVKLLIHLICLLSFMSLAIAIYNYVRSEKD
ncbi:hypothetical protein DIX83_03130 [Streptococcus iniae]|uniref:Uncharacterized protein n=2 Tax=Streptococcus iniae TaxID=1346 RepID=A0A3L8GKR1_STRIN|nr:hypothetical protein DQ08_03345 [Streptococcus iniae]AHY17379.1 hypothetical protein DW64_03340 [Streptococcus iniae]AJG26938.1 hypothetical protein SI82_03575 [Streptococcus iniae]APD32839.1 hypothetical protein BMF34_03470 [Streptococcus iniae]ASL34495.1 hypothetical protein QMA0248_0686 [Streptococcus iniae]